MSFRVSLVQMDIPYGEPERNLEHGLALAQTVSGDSDLLLFPELFTTGYALDRADALAAHAPATLERLSHWAKSQQATVSGSILHPWAGGVANAGFLIEPDGTLATLYAKAHLFRPMEEEKYLVGGSERVLWPGKIGQPTLAPAICYDLRFPEMLRHLALEGAEILLVPAEWPAVRADHWKLLTAARAVENGFFVAAANRVGSQNGIDFGGDSRVVDPWGAVVAEAAGAETCITANMDLARIAEARARIPALEDRVEGVDTFSPAATSNS